MATGTPYREPARVRTVPAFVAALSFAALVVVGVVFALRSELPARSAPPQIRIVTEGAEAVEPSATEAAHVSNTASAREDEKADSVEGNRRVGERKPRTGPDPLSLTRAFRKQQGKVTGCFTRHTSAVEQLPMMQLEFDLAASGKIDAVRVLPANLAGTPLGKCLADVASSTHFPSQGRAVSFAIPITADRAR